MQPTARLAPTPSGHLHIGNARSFLLAWLWARSQGGRVIMRIEDIDRPRCKPGLREQVLRDLEWLGLDWDAGPRADEPAGEFDQSTRTDIYREYLQRLIDSGVVYPCACSRKDIEHAASAPNTEAEPIYPGTCVGRFRDAAEAQREAGRPPAWRFALAPGDWSYDDLVRGRVVTGHEIGDFVAWRRDDIPSYQLACVVDDALTGVTQVLRGRDQVLSTGRQLAIYEALGFEPPREWAHVQLMAAAGRRMAKRDDDLSMKVLQERGVKTERLTGFLAWSCSLIDRLEPVAARELVGEFKLPRHVYEDFEFTNEHLEWLHAEVD